MINMMKILKDGGMNEVYREMMRLLWYSPEVSEENKGWLDMLSDKENFRFSEIVRIQDLYIKIFGQLPK